MSFTSTVKNEVSKLELLDVDDLSELSAIIRNIGQINNGLKMTTENASVARRIFNLIKNHFHTTCKITVRKGYNFNKNYIYILELQKNLDIIINTLSLKNNIPDSNLVDDEELKRAYIRGLFLSTGSINDPKTSRYHLELIVDNEEYAEYICQLLNEFKLNSKYIKRETKFMIYLKEAEKISDFLRIMNAIQAVFYYEDIRIYRDHKNMTNRLNNCEQANVDKIIETATKQVKDIELLKEKDLFDVLDDKTKEAATYRLKYYEASLLELSEIISLETGNAITKSGLYHRFNKIKNIASKIREKE